MHLGRLLLLMLLLTRLLPTRPLELLDRLTAFAANRGRRSVSADVDDAPSWTHALEALGTVCSAATPAEILQEPRFVHTVTDLEQRIHSLGAELPFRSEHNGDPALYSLSYLLTRLLQPDVVVESGVAHGVTTALVLAALAENGHGELHSIDLPPLTLRADRHVGCLVPEELRSRWVLHRGTTARVLPRLVRGLPPIGLFIHDSLFTLRNTVRELELAHRHFAPEAAAVVNCVHRSPAFCRWVNARSPSLALTVSAERKRDRIGIALFGGHPEPDPPPLQSPQAPLPGTSAATRTDHPP